MGPAGCVQRQLREDWDNREYEQIIADNIKNIANFLSSFGIVLLLFGLAYNNMWHDLEVIKNEFGAFSLIFSLICFLTIVGQLWNENWIQILEPIVYFLFNLNIKN